MFGDVSRTNVEAESLRSHSLASIMQSLKGYTSFKSNKLLGRKGEFWAHESYDHYIAIQKNGAGSLPMY
jgi:hypothetical protein